MGRISITQISAIATSSRTSKSRRFGLNIVFKVRFIVGPRLLPEALFCQALCRAFGQLPSVLSCLSFRFSGSEGHLAAHQCDAHPTRQLVAAKWCVFALAV